MTALDKLIEAVEPGEATPHLVRQVFDTPCQDIARQGIKPTVWMAYKGSLDAALALHEALLPGRTLTVGQNAHHGDWNAWVRYAEDGTILDEYTAASDTAARSLLLAILRAYRSVQA